MEWHPMLARDGAESLLDDDDYLFEPKLDGIRALVRYEGTLSIFSRNDRDITLAYPEIELPIDRQCVLDGEIVLYDGDGNPDFGSLLARHHRKVPPRTGRPVTFAAFDVLTLDGRPLVDAPIEERRSALEEILVDPGPRAELTLVTDQGRKLFDAMRMRGLEGVIAKRKHSKYYPGARADVWRKVKVYRTADVIIIGFHSDKKPVSSLEIGAYDSSGIVSLGRVGAGLSDRMGRVLREALDSIAIGREADITRVQPRIVVEVRYLQRTRDGSLRHASLLRVRTDKRPEDVRLDEVVNADH